MSLRRGWLHCEESESQLYASSCMIKGKGTASLFFVACHLCINKSLLKLISTLSRAKFVSPKSFSMFKWISFQCDRDCGNHVIFVTTNLLPSLDHIIIHNFSFYNIYVRHTYVSESTQSRNMAQFFQLCISLKYGLNLMSHLLTHVQSLLSHMWSKYISKP